MLSCKPLKRGQPCGTGSDMLISATKEAASQNQCSLCAGDLVRYSAFALCSGRLASFGLPAFVAFVNIYTIKQQNKDQHKRYGADFEHYRQKTPLLIPYTWPASSAGGSPASKGAEAKSR